MMMGWDGEGRAGTRHVFQPPKARAQEEKEERAIERASVDLWDLAGERGSGCGPEGRVRERASVLAAQGVEGGMEGADDVECIENCSVVDGTGADIGVRGGEQGSLRTRWARRRGMCERDE